MAFYNAIPVDILKQFVRNYSILLFTDKERVCFVDVFRNSFSRFLTSLQAFQHAKVDLGCLSRGEVPDFVLGFLAKLKFALSLLKSNQSISSTTTGSNDLVSWISSYVIPKEESIHTLVYYSPLDDINSLENIQDLMMSLFKVKD